MPTVPEAEARRLLARQLTCEGVTDWLPRNNGQTLQIQAGLIDEAGMKTDLFVKLSFKPGLRTSDARYTFSVFRINSYGLDRVYQLCVSRVSKRETDAHRKPHEHLGSLRNVGSAAWQKWEYEEVLARFCAQTKIVFMPTPQIRSEAGKDGIAMSNLADMFGNSYQVFDDDENLVSVGTSLEFWDDDPFALYVERVGSRIRIFDDGIVVMHMLGSGIDYGNDNLMQSIASIAEPEGVLLNDEGDFEIWAEASGVSDAFAHYMSAMVALLKWEAAEVNRLSTPRA